MDFYMRIKTQKLIFLRHLRNQVGLQLSIQTVLKFALEIGSAKKAKSLNISELRFFSLNYWFYWVQHGQKWSGDGNLLYYLISTLGLRQIHSCASPIITQAPKFKWAISWKPLDFFFLQTVSANLFYSHIKFQKKKSKKSKNIGWYALNLRQNGSTQLRYWNSLNSVICLLIIIIILL